MSVDLQSVLNSTDLEGPEATLAHPTLASDALFDYPHLPGEHLKKVYNTLYKAIDPDFEHAPKRMLALLPRGSGKSDGVCVVFPTWVILCHPELRVAVVSKTADLASERTKKVVEHVEHYAPAFGVELETPVPDTELETVANDHKEPTIVPYGLESQLTGKHFDVILYDDIVDWENQRTETQRRNVRNYWQDYERNLPDDDSEIEGGPIQAVIGTRKHPQDIYATDIIDSPRWSVIEHKAIAEEDWPIVENRAWSLRGTDGGVYDSIADLPPGVQVAPNGVIPDHDINVLWPEHRPPETVLYDLIDGDDSVAIWRRENQQDPDALSGEVFQSDWLIYENELPKPASQYRWYAGMDVGVVDDLQKAAENDTDYSAIGVLAYDDADDRGYVTNLTRRRGLSVKANADWAADWLLDDVGDKYEISFDAVLVEANKAPGVAQRLRDETPLPARPVESSSNKEGRIHDLSADFESGDLRIVGDPTAETWREFEIQEWLQFPNAAHDDRLDGIELANRSTTSGGTVAQIGSMRDLL